MYVQTYRTNNIILVILLYVIVHVYITYLVIIGVVRRADFLPGPGAACGLEKPPGNEELLPSREAESIESRCILLGKQDTTHNMYTAADACV